MPHQSKSFCLFLLNMFFYFILWVLVALDRALVVGVAMQLVSESARRHKIVSLKINIFSKTSPLPSSFAPFPLLLLLINVEIWLLCKPVLHSIENKLLLWSNLNVDKYILINMDYQRRNSPTHWTTKQSLTSYVGPNIFLERTTTKNDWILTYYCLQIITGCFKKRTHFRFANFSASKIFWKVVLYIFQQPSLCRIQK